MFRPLHGAHAIREVVFVFIFAARLPPSLILQVGNNLQVPWRDFAPKRSEIRPLSETVLAERGILLPLAPQGFYFEGFKRDGSLSWRVAIEPDPFDINRDRVSVNCLEYSGWESVWPTVREWVRWIFSQSAGSAIPVFALGLQYLNEFLWEGSISECNPTKLVRSGSPAIPQALFDVTDPRWHLHTGHYEPGGALGYPGERLSRVHIDSRRLVLSDGIQSASATIDIFQRLSLEPVVDIAADLDGEGRVDQIFRQLHELVKCELENYLLKDLLESMNLRY